MSHLAYFIVAVEVLLVSINRRENHESGPRIFYLSIFPRLSHSRLKLFFATVALLLFIILSLIL